MIDIRRLDHYYYSQNSLNTFHKCPWKFKMKYMDRLSWKQDGVESHPYYENMKKGLDFHLLCERYFSNIPLGLKENEEDHRKLIYWMENLKGAVPILDENQYLPEYEIKINNGKIRLQAKYDLIILKDDNEIEIWDWKTEDRKLTQGEMEKRFQTMVYMYMMKEAAEEIFHRRISFDAVKMIFWQPQYPWERIGISYSEERHRMYQHKIQRMVSDLEDYDFEEDFDKTLYQKHCSYCEFNYLCNGGRVAFDLTE